MLHLDTSNGSFNGWSANRVTSPPSGAPTATRAIFREAFQSAGLPYFNPHSLRSTLVQLGETVCKTPEEFKAWSQNLGHEEVLTTFRSYGAVGTQRQSQIIRDLAKPQQPESPNVEQLAKALAQEMRIRN